MTKQDVFDLVGIERVLGRLALEYINGHCVLKQGRRYYEGDPYVLNWYQAHMYRQQEEQAKKQSMTRKTP